MYLGVLAATDDEIKAEVDKAAASLGAPTAKDMGAVMKVALTALKATGKTATHSTDPLADEQIKVGAVAY